MLPETSRSQGGIRSDTIWPVTAATTLRAVRHRAGLSLRQLAAAAGTSHSTLSAYESGRKAPSVETFDRIVRAAGFTPSVEIAPSVGGPEPGDRGRELLEVLRLADRFPARHSPTLDFPRFGSP
jgi:transcriptional regulator with XRE-family HTH domain